METPAFAFSDAEPERRRIKKRQKKRYEEERNRGAATPNGLASDCYSPGRRAKSAWIGCCPRPARRPIPSRC